MLTFRKLIYFLFLIHAVVACDSKSNKSVKGNSGANTANIKPVQAKLNYNKLELPKYDLKIEVIYKIDEENAIYEEWVKINHKKTEKITNFKFNFSKENYQSFKSNESNYYSTFESDKRAVQLTEDQIISLNGRFNNEISADTFSDLIRAFKSESKDPDSIKTYDNSCQNDWKNQRQMIIDYYNVGFQQCYYSKYSELAREDARLFLNSNRYLSYRRLFGLDLVYPQIATYSEINADDDKFLALGTAYSPRSYFVRSDLNKIMGEECKGQFINKNTSDLSQNRNLFMGGQKDPVFIDAHYFLRACGRQYEVSKPIIGSEIISLYPNTSQFFKEWLAQFVSTSFNIENIDKRVSSDLDIQIERYNFLLEKYNESLPKEIYEHWKKIQIKEFDIQFDAYLPVGTYDNAFDDFNSLKSIISNAKSRSRFFGDKIDLYLLEDEQAVRNLEKYILLVDIFKK